MFTARSWSHCEPAQGGLGDPDSRERNIPRIEHETNHCPEHPRIPSSQHQLIPLSDPGRCSPDHLDWPIRAAGTPSGMARASPTGTAFELGPLLDRPGLDDGTGRRSRRCCCPGSAGRFVPSTTGRCGSPGREPGHRPDACHGLGVQPVARRRRERDRAAGLHQRPSPAFPCHRARLFRAASVWG